MTKFSTIILGVDRFLLLPMAFEGRHYWVNHLMTYLKKKQSGTQCYEESVLVYFTWCRSGFERCWKTKEIEMNNEVTKFSTIILGVDRFLLLLMAFEGRHY